MKNKNLLKNQFSKIEIFDRNFANETWIDIKSPTTSGFRIGKITGSDAVRLSFLLNQKNWIDMIAKPVFRNQKNLLERYGVLVPQSEIPRSPLFKILDRSLVLFQDVKLLDRSPASALEAEFVGKSKSISWLKDSYTGLCFPCGNSSLEVTDRTSSPREPAASRRLRSNQLAKQMSQSWVAVIPQFFLPPVVKSLSRYYSDCLKKGFLLKGDERIEKCFWAHNESFASFLHPQMTAFISKIAGRPMKPSYSYFRDYEAGSALEPHLDRAQCEMTLTIQIRHERYRHVRPKAPWPLLYQARGQKSFTPCYLSPGDAVLFYGRKVKHFRPRLPRGEAYASLMFHFVDKEFSGTLK